MLVRCIKKVSNYNGIREVLPGEISVVYAKERDHNNQLFYYVMPLGVDYSDGEYDPLFFDAEGFEIVEDKASKDWQTKQVKLRYGTVEYTSFPEWFENEFYIRAHDWSLHGDDYKIMKKYKDQYEELYKDYL